MGWPDDRRRRARLRHRDRAPATPSSSGCPVTAVRADAGGAVTVAALVPGMPHLLAARTRRRAGPSWPPPRAEVGDRLRAAGVGRGAAAVDPVVHRARPPGAVRPRAARHAAPTRTGTATTTGTSPRPADRRRPRRTRWADAIDAAGMQARRTRYDGFPIDTGTVTASRAARPGRARALGHGVLQPVRRCRRRWRAVGRGRGARGAATGGSRVVAVSGLSSGLIQRWITPDRGPLRERRARPVEPEGARRHPGRRATSAR